MRVSETATDKIRIMTFNTWRMGTMVNNGQEKVAKHIKAVDPDLVALQEAHKDNEFHMVQSLLGHGWTTVSPNE